MATEAESRRAGTLTDPVLVVVDMQNDFCKPGYAYDEDEKELSHIERAVERTGEFLSRYRASGRKPVLVRTTHDDDSNDRLWGDKYENRAMPCHSGTDGAEFVPELGASESDLIVTKHRYNAFYGTDLDLYLSSNDVTSLLVAGVATNVCVASTVRAAFDRGYDVTLLSDCVGAADQSRHDHTLGNVEDFFGTVAESSEVDLPPP